MLDEKYDKLVHIGKAIPSIRNGIGKDERVRIPLFCSYLDNLGTDADLLKEFISHINADEEAAMREKYPHEMERTDRIIADTITLNTPPELPNAPHSSQSTVSAADIHSIVHNAVQTVVDGQKPEKQYTDKQNPLLGEVVQTFLNQKSSGTKRSSQSWYRLKCESFKEILTVLNDGKEPRLSQVSADIVRDYTDLMHRYPKEVSKQKQLRDMPFPQLVSLVQNANTRSEIEGQGIAVMSLTTVGHYFTAVRDFLRWTEDKYTRHMDGMPTNLDSIVKVAGKAKPAKRVPFADQDLKCIFESDKYIHARFKRPSEYWIALLALFTGARQGELCQLYVSDVYTKNGVPVIDINANDDKSLKNEDGTPRLVPVHKHLEELGFLDFVKAAKEKKQVRLFPEEKRDANGNFGAYSKRFNRYRTSVGIKANKNEMKDFHSFRHLVADFLIRNECEEYIANKIVGHKPKVQTETTKTYAKNLDIKTLNKWVQKLKFDIDFKYAKLWR